MLSFFGWHSHFSKNDKLEALRNAAEVLDQRIERLTERHDRLMNHLNLVEVNGPRIVVIPSVDAF